MASRIFVGDVFTGRVREILIDGISYPSTNDGVNITPVAQYDLKFVAGSMAPRVRVLSQYYKIDLVLAENTLSALQLAWNLTLSPLSTGTFNTLPLGKVQTPTVHTLQVNVHVNSGARMRRFIFDQVCFFDLHPQVNAPQNLVNIPCSFYAYANSAATAGYEFGRIESDDPIIISPSAFALLTESSGYLLTEYGEYLLID